MLVGALDEDGYEEGILSFLIRVLNLIESVLVGSLDEDVDREGVLSFLIGLP